MEAIQYVGIGLLAVSHYLCYRNGFKNGEREAKKPCCKKKEKE
jgi:hypothetical protein